ncbi:hypothetical protein QBC47DRAFT_358031 [Echria macrotheca]|uniref:Uncharacterized protein n=1 Tax=Echria macrotheca TaxID=438768 RepID=A0AAJ0BH31_9PEZI|nr:hypothetical protein QBC47DRAFT_358031 [Echria macrotheca]
MFSSCNRTPTRFSGVSFASGSFNPVVAFDRSVSVLPGLGNSAFRKDVSKTCDGLYYSLMVYGGVVVSEEVDKLVETLEHRAGFQNYHYASLRLVRPGIGEGDPQEKPWDSQHHSGLAVKLTCFEDLTEDQTKRCDDLILKLGRANLTNDVPSAETRKGLWDRVFNGWDTDDLIVKPHPKPSSRPTGDTQIQFGWINQDLPGKKKLAQWRKAGAPAYNKPNVTGDNSSVLYNLGGLPGITTVSYTTWWTSAIPDFQAPPSPSWHVTFMDGVSPNRREP